MPDRAGQIVKLVCLALAALVVYQLAHIVPRVNPLRGVTVPTLPALAEKTNAAPTSTGGTNSQTASKGTNKAVEMAGTNLPTSKSTNGSNSNLVATAPASKSETNTPAETGKTNVETAVVSTNASSAAPLMGATNIVTTNSAAITNLASATNATVTNGSNMAVLGGTNGPGMAKLNRKGTNSGAAAMMRAGMGMNPRGAPAAELPPEIRARINRIYDSEILAQVMHPLPMGLIGIAGDVAFLRADSGQTGLIKEGETLGDLKLIQIGINRVLVEQAGQKKELTIFDGYGGKSLLPGEKEKTE